MPVVAQSRFPFAETVRRLEEAIAAGGNTVFSTIDQAAAAQTAGLHLRPTVLIIFGNPKAGTLLMEASPLAALELPLKLLVWEDGGAVNVGYVSAAEIEARYAIAGKHALIAAMDNALATLRGTVTGTPAA